MAPRTMIPFLVAMMLLTGVANTILTKKQDMVCVRNCDAEDPKQRAFFNQPVLQTLQMFIGEMGCWLVVGGMNLYKRYVSRSPSSEGYEAVNTDDGGAADGPTTMNGASDPGDETPAKPDDARPLGVLQGRRVLLLAIPAICDICGTTLMNIGLLLVAASIYQMTRGALVLFVGVFSVVFLKRNLFLYQWLSLAGVVLGVAIVGLAGVIYPDSQAERASELHYADDGGPSSAVLALVGVLLIAFAQIFTATQFVVEESIMEKSTIDPIKVVGWEGIFGFSVTTLAMVVLHFAVGRTKAGQYGYFDMAEGWRQVRDYPELLVTSVMIMISIGGFNFFGLSVTRSVSATSRSTIDTCRTLFIWIVSLGLGWESFKWLQVLGFALLVYSTFLFNNVVQPPLKCLVVDEPVQELLPEEPIEHQ